MQWLVLLSHNKKVLGSRPSWGRAFGVCMFSLYLHGLLWSLYDSPVINWHLLQSIHCCSLNIRWDQIQPPYNMIQNMMMIVLTLYARPDHQR